MNSHVGKVDHEMRITVEIDDGPILAKSYGKRVYRLDRVDLTYRRTDDGAWGKPAVELSGWYLKKDGSNGVDRNTEHVYSFTRDEFDWLPALEQRYHPREVES